MSHMPEVRGNPALQTPDAVQELVQRILPTVAAWALERCNDAILAQDLGGTMRGRRPSRNMCVRGVSSSRRWYRHLHRSRESPVPLHKEGENST